MAFHFKGTSDLGQVECLQVVIFTAKATLLLKYTCTRDSPHSQELHAAKSKGPQVMGVALLSRRRRLCLHRDAGRYNVTMVTVRPVTGLSCSLSGSLHAHRLI
jgi:hypothetical protein